jgi:hypothetical protein
MALWASVIEEALIALRTRQSLAHIASIVILGMDELISILGLPTVFNNLPEIQSSFRCLSSQVVDLERSLLAFRFPSTLCSVRLIL